MNRGCSVQGSELWQHSRLGCTGLGLLLMCALQAGPPCSPVPHASESPTEGETQPCWLQIRRVLPR